MIAAAVNVPIMPWKATSIKFMIFCEQQTVSSQVTTWKGSAFLGLVGYLSLWPIVRICARHVGNRVEIESAMSAKKVLSMLFGKRVDLFL